MAADNCGGQQMNVDPTHSASVQVARFDEGHDLRVGN
jgi:hypothetical protein